MVELRVRAQQHPGAEPRLELLQNGALVVLERRHHLGQLPGGAGYVLRFYPAWSGFPTEDLAADARRMNAFIEDRVREMPEQYFWLHKRFKTRPPGEAKFYET